MYGWTDLAVDRYGSRHGPPSIRIRSVGAHQGATLVKGAGHARQGAGVAAATSVYAGYMGVDPSAQRFFGVQLAE